MCHQAELSVKIDAAAPSAADPTNLNEVVKTTRKEKIDVFLSKIIPWMNESLAPGK